jgi:hypothetical protein
MGAAAFVVERNSEAEQRGVQPIAEFLGLQQPIQPITELDLMLNTWGKWSMASSRDMERAMGA